jgi:hypothetical protein
MSNDALSELLGARQLMYWSFARSSRHLVMRVFMAAMQSKSREDLCQYCDEASGRFRIAVVVKEE